MSESGKPKPGSNPGHSIDEGEEMNKDEWIQRAREVMKEIIRLDNIWGTRNNEVQFLLAQDTDDEDDEDDYSLTLEFVDEEDE